jgi:hypothetical protein
MPAPLSTAAQSQYAALLASSGMTARVRALSADILVALDTVDALNWSEDLAGIGVAIPTDADERENVRKSLASAFGAVASEVSESKRGANVRIFDVPASEDEDGNEVPACVEVAVAFRTVRERSGK